ncbi:unnamed protein product [Phytophthora fragariaefolia]|uniref:Unnamed protein product n=1 Tax=Phytophthora fragariaefolia TaxID=1490495 RepID=A0A9W6WWB0_9STRA|nr:unnamed protein product [Phytophthora fragariaefolia]
MADKPAAYPARPVDGYQGRPGEAPPVYQGRPVEYQVRVANGSQPYQGRPMEPQPGYQGRMVERAPGYQGVPPAYQGRMNEGASGYPARSQEPPTTAAAAAAYQGRMIQGPQGYQGRVPEGSAGKMYQGRVPEGSGGNMYQGRVPESSADNMYQGRPEGSLGKMAEDYKRERKLPPRVEEMLREQVNLDESVLHDAFAVAMEDLIPEKEANFVAKGLCHLCGMSENNYVPVVNFCPHADERHSLCREHLRSVYRVRMEALFVGRNGSAPNRRLLRCLICTHGCPCTSCTAEKEKEVQKYKRYLLDTLRRSGQGSVPTVTSDRATSAAAAAAATSIVVAAAAATSAAAAVAVSAPISTPDRRMAYGSAQSVGTADGRRYAQYPPTSSAEGRPPIQRDSFSARNAEPGNMYEGRRQLQTQQPEYEQQYQADGRNDRDGYASMQAQQKSPSQYPLGPKRAAKDTSGDMLSVMADSAQASDSRVAARVASPRVHPSSVDSPSAATVINCAESEKSLVRLLSSLNQNGTPTTSGPMDTSSQSSKESNRPQNELRHSTNGIVLRNGNAQDSGDAEVQALPRVHPGRGIADRRRQTDSPYQDQSSTSSMDSGDSTPRERLRAIARPVAAPQAQKQKASESDGEESEKPKQNAGGSDGEDSAAHRDSEEAVSRNDSRATHRNERTGEEEDKKHHDHHGQRPRPLASTVRDDRERDSGSKAIKEENHAAPPQPQRRGPGRPRKVQPDGAPATSRAVEKKSSQDRKTTPPPKTKGRGRGRGRGRGKRATKRLKRMIQDDDDTEDEAYNEEDDGDDEDEDDDDSDSELDANLDFCEVCQRAGDLVCCDKCPRSYHLRCLHMTQNDLPEGDWQCAECKKPSRFDAYSKAVGAEQSLLDRCLKIVECLKSHPFSKPFLEPVENVPLYTRVVKQPMDLSKIENKLKKGAYIVDSNTVAAGVKELDSTHFANDIRLMWSNCKLFNDDGSGITRAADILSAGFERLYKESIRPPLSS